MFNPQQSKEPSKGIDYLLPFQVLHLSIYIQGSTSLKPLVIEALFYYIVVIRNNSSFHFKFHCKKKPQYYINGIDIKYVINSKYLV